MENKNKKMIKWLESEEWVNLPEEIKKDILRFNNLCNWVEKRKKRIEGLKTKISELKEERRKWEVERNNLYDKLHKFQNEFKILISPTQSPKYSKNQFQWRVNITIGEVKRTLYLGSNKNVRKVLDKSLGVDLYVRTTNKNESTNDMKRIIVQKIKKRIVTEMENNYGEFITNFEEKKLKLINYLN
jgi:hypothetical protein